MGVIFKSGSSNLIFKSGSSNLIYHTIQSGLVGYWDFNGDAKDKTPKSNNGTFEGNPVASLTTDRKGQSNKAYAFVKQAVANDSTIIRVTDPAGGELDFGTADFSVSFWMNVTDIPTGITNARAVRKGAENSSTAGYCFFVSQVNGSTSFAISDGQGGGDGVDRIIIASGAISLGTWHHIVGYRSGANMYIYVDNIQKDSGVPPDGSINTSTSLLFGSAATGSALAFTGSLSKIRIYNRAITTAEIAFLYNFYM